MKIRANTLVVGVCRAGDVVDLPDTRARKFIERGIAFPLDDEPVETLADNDTHETENPPPKRKKKK